MGKELGIGRDLIIASRSHLMSEPLPSVRLSYENTMDDAVAFYMYQMKHSPHARRRRRIGLTIAYLWLLGSYFFAFGGLANLSYVLIYTVATIGAILLLGLILRWIVGDRLIRRQYAKNQYREFFGRHELEVADDGLRFRTDYSEGKLAWSLIDRIESIPDYTFIYTGTKTGLIIPHARITEGNYRVFFEELGKRYKAD